jgi:hypothetical protein
LFDSFVERKMTLRQKLIDKRVYQCTLAIILVGLVVIGGLMALTLRRAQPFVRQLIVETLSHRFHGRAELGELHVSVARTIEVSGEDIRIFGPEDPNPHEPGIQPLLAGKKFWFTVSLLDFFHSPLQVDRVYLRGLEVNIPPPGHRAVMKSSREEKVKLQVNELVCDDARLIINTSRPDKLPLEFAITQLRMSDIGPKRPSHFEATLVNPKPIGDIQSKGLFGPWQLDDLRSTPVEGRYSFSNADLSTINGIGGILSSTGEYQGTLGSIAVNGETDTPDFRLAITNRPVPLHTDFHAVVDGTNGNVQLQPVNAKLLNSTFVANGSIIHVKDPKGRVDDPKGHQIDLTVTSTDSRIEDLLQLGVRTDPPVMTGRAVFKAALKMPPGSDDVMDRITIAGRFRVSKVHFINNKVQSKVDGFSRRTQRKRGETRNNVASELDGTFALANRRITFPRVRFQIPGTNILMAGRYSLDGNVFEFHGTAEMEAKLSQMTTGWKSALLKPVDPFFSKHGHGTVVPIKVTGTKSEPHIGLDFRGKGKDKNLDK